MKEKLSRIVSKYKEDYVQEIKEVIEHIWNEMESVVDEYEQKMNWSISWCPEDVQEYSKEHWGYALSDQEAADILEDVIHHHDCEYGINWDGIGEYIWAHIPEEYKRDTEELFNEAKVLHCIAPDEELEDWQYERCRLVEILQEEDKRLRAEVK